ncbi:hypothetical protein ENSA7_63500 [Enhygromyxa salina]|uniref:Uncharacterized protein n=2 Tax=Enhygromyxa salina TaxID=215803 RepID=A0A2S9Y2H5_9BACT|nr:hypothetical protein ENSA7_63500 [Enhygromyxa salina]
MGCGAEPVTARAVWVDGLGADGVRSIHVYDRGHRYDFDVLGETDPHERVRLGPSGRGVLVRADVRAGAWFDLDDGRRLPLVLPPTTPGGDGPVNFTARGDALWWREQADGSLNLVPLAPGVPLQRRDDGSVIPVVEPAGAVWVVGSLDAPRLLVKHPDGSASYFRHGDADDPSAALVREATTDALWLPDEALEARQCAQATGCFTLVGVEPAGELAIIYAGGGGWSIFDRRAPHQAGQLELPDQLAAAAAGGGGLGLLHVIDRSVSVWLGAGQLVRWDRAAGIVEATPVFAKPPLVWAPVDRGRALVLLSLSGSMYRVDAERTTVLNLQTTDCSEEGASAPVISPRGDWASWSCHDSTTELTATSGVVVRASVNGLERYVGVPLLPLAIDDEGDLLGYSVASLIMDEVDGVASFGRPRSLFVLTGEGVLTRIDELEPAPAPIVSGAGDIATYIQGAALDASLRTHGSVR